MEQLILRIILERAGHDLYFAEDGEEALAIYANEGIQIVITDLFLPHIGGLELIRVLKRLFPDAVIIAVSGKGSQELAMAKLEGAGGYDHQACGSRGAHQGGRRSGRG